MTLTFDLDLDLRPGIAEFAGLENDGLENDELENDGVSRGDVRTAHNEVNAN